MRSYGRTFGAAALTSAVILFFGPVLARSATNRLTLSPAVQKTNLIAGFRLQPGFRIELAAAEPMVASPVALAFDENNRLYVAERRNPFGPAENQPSSGRIRLLEDPDEN